MLRCYLVILNILMVFTSSRVKSEHRLFDTVLEMWGNGIQQKHNTSLKSVSDLTAIINKKEAKVGRKNCYKNIYINM